MERQTLPTIVTSVMLLCKLYRQRWQVRGLTLFDILTCIIIILPIVVCISHCIPVRWENKTTRPVMIDVDVFFIPEVTQADIIFTSKKKILEVRLPTGVEPSYNLPVTTPDALPVSYRGLVGAKAIKLRSYC